MQQTMIKERTAATKTRYAPGTFIWADLATTDARGAKKFYSELFGWQTDDRPMGNGMVYSILKKDGHDVGALYEVDKSAATGQSIHPRWDSYILVDDVDKKVEEARKLGAKVLTEPFDIFDEGRMAMIEDPVGAGVCFWQAKNRTGADRFNEVGALCWNELHTTEVDKAKSFYEKLFGWKTVPMDMGAGGQEYLRFDNGERPNGGLLGAYATKGQPGYWLAYFTVKNIKESIKTTKQHGGKVVFGPMDFEFGSLAVITDPQGGYLGLWQGGEKS